MAEQQITGVCVEVSQKPGSDWCEFHIDGGGKYPVRLSTKMQPVIELGRAVGQNLATWTYNEVDSGKPNPHQPGTNFLNRYLERVEVGGAETQPNATPSEQRPPVLGSDKDRLIVRQTCIKAAAELYSGTGLTDPEQHVMQAAAAFEKWVVLGILEDLPF